MKRRPRFLVLLGLLLTTAGASAQFLDLHRLRELKKIGTEEALSECQTLARSALRRANPGSWTEALGTHELAGCLMAAGQHKDAIPLTKRAIETWKAQQDTLNESIATNSLGVGLLGIGDYTGALDIFKKSLPFRIALGREQEISTRITLSTVQVYLGQYQDALDTIRPAVALTEPPGPEHLKAAVTGNLGMILMLSGKPDQAPSWLLTSIALSKRSGAKREEAYSTNNLCRTYILTNAIRRAVDCLYLAVEDFSDVVDPHIQATLRVNLSVALLLASQPEEALIVANKALEVLKERQVPELQGRVLGSMFRALEAMGKPRLAAEVGTAAVSKFEETRRTLAGRDRREGRTFLDSKADIYRDLIRLLVDQERIAQAQFVLKLLKDQEYYEYTRGDTTGQPQTGAALPSAASGGILPRFESSLDLDKERLAIIRKRRDGALTSEDENRLASIERSISLRHREYIQALTEAERSMAQAATTEFARPSIRYLESIRTSLRDLGEGTVLVSYVTTPERLYIFVSTSGPPVSFTLPVKRKELASKILTFREEIQNYQNGDTAKLKELGKQLFTILIEPIEKELAAAGVKTLMLSLDGALRYLPFAALHDGQKFLIERYPVALYTPASSSRLKDNRSSEWKVAGMGISRPIGGFRPLIHVPDELSAIVRGTVGGVFPGEVCLNECFTIPKLKETLALSFPVVHLATHFRFLPGNETDSFLVMGSGPPLTLKTIREAPIDFEGVDLLTLSACETALGGDGPSAGVEIEGLGVLVQNQGAKAVIATLWPVYDPSTPLMMRSLYARLNESQSFNKATALQTSQLEMLKQTPTSNGYSHPYFWAPFVLIGNWK